MKRRIFPVLVALILIALIAWRAIDGKKNGKEDYGTEVMDLRTYYDVEEGKLAIFVQDERLAEKAVIKNRNCYLNYNFVKSFLNDQFYYDRTEKRLLYTDALGSFEARPGSEKYYQYGQEKSLSIETCYLEGESLFLALPYVALFSDVDYQLNDYRVKFITSWDPYEAALLTENTKVRYQADAKSEILCEVFQGESLAVHETTGAWTRVETEDGIIGYVENNCLGTTLSIQPERKTAEREYVVPEYTSKKLNEKVCLGWHAIGGMGGNETLGEVLADSNGMNVISPTWFSLNDNEGGFRSFADATYVKRAHKYGIEVWGAIDDFNYENESGENIDDTVIFSASSSRENMIGKLMEIAADTGLDGINVDFEKVGSDCAEHYGQFLRELSVACRKNGLKLSIDNYVPNEGNKQYRLDVQGKVADYVILMGYDEHWHGSGNPGSVASIGFISDGIDKALKSVPADKLVNAVPFYTILWKIDGSDVKDEYLTLVNQQDFINRIGKEPVWDEETCQNYIEWSSNGKTYKVWLEDLDSISVKLNVMSANNLAGVAAWRLGYGTPQVWKLLGAFKKM